MIDLSDLLSSLTLITCPHNLKPPLSSIIYELSENLFFHNGDIINSVLLIEPKEEKKYLT